MPNNLVTGIRYEDWNDHQLRIYLDRKLEPGETVEIKNLGINFYQEFQSYPICFINTWGGDDAAMIDEDFVRVGNPSIDLVESQVFIFHQMLTNWIYAIDSLNTIIIQESNYRLYGRDGEGQKLHYQSILVGLNYIASLDIQVPDDKFDDGSQRIVDDGHSLLFDLINGAHLLPQDIITIYGAYVIPQSLSDFNVDQNTLLGLSINDKNNGFDTDENQQSHYLAVDDFSNKVI